MKRLFAIVLALMMVLSLGVVAFADEETAEEEVVVEYPLADDGIMTVVPLTEDNLGIFTAEGTYSDDGSVTYEGIEQVCYKLPETYSLSETILIHATGTSADNFRIFLVNESGWSRASEVTTVEAGDFDLWIEITVEDAESKGVIETYQFNFKGSSSGAVISAITISSVEILKGSTEDYIVAGRVNCGLTGHTVDEHTSNNDATCTSDGTKIGVCSVCGEEVTVTDEGTALGDSFTNYVSNNDATCISDGTMTAECDNGCGETDTVTDEGTATGHNYENGVCTNCGAEGSDYSAFPTTAVVIVIIVVVVAVAVILVISPW
ncbi:MAG: hypothetical protein LIO49_09385 [Ruminococcus sp.]|nr:hypothetical protein [Ruminococcus sp.]